MNDLFPAWADGEGILTYLWRTHLIPWEDPDTEPLLDTPYDLDLEYHGNISGSKRLSPLALRLHEGDGAFDYDVRTWLANTIVRLYGNTWTREYATLSAEYNPIENYSMEEKLTNDKTVESGGTESTRTDDLTRTHKGSVTTTPAVTIAADDQVYGFNSAQPSPVTSREQRSTGTETTDNDLTDKDTGTQTTKGKTNGSKTRNYTLTRAGNIGVTTSQQMLQSERDLWMWNFFHEVVFPSIDEVLTIPVY